jgi:hypothetical protein
MLKQTLTEIKKGQVGTGLLIENDGYISLDLEGNENLMESVRLNESEGTRVLPSPFIVSAVFQKFDIENANGRIYPEHILKREVEKYQKFIAERRSYGEANHPDTSTISIDRIAMMITELHWVEHTLVGKMMLPITDGFRKYGIVSTLADLVAHWILSGLKIGVSSRGMGTVRQEMGKIIVCDDYEIVCWDVVTQPSTPSAWIEETSDNLTPYLENKENKGEIIKEDKFSKFENWLNG